MAKLFRIKYIPIPIAAVFILISGAMLPGCQDAAQPSGTAIPPGQDDTSSTGPTTSINVDELKGKLDSDVDLLLVDIRTKASYDSGHIEGAVSMPLEEMPDRLSEISKDIEVIVYTSCA